MKSTPSGRRALMASAVPPLMPATSVTMAPGAKKALCSAKKRIMTADAVQKIIIPARFKAALPVVYTSSTIPSCLACRRDFSSGSTAMICFTPMRRRPRAKEPPMSPKPMMATVSFVLKPLASVSITHPAFLIILVRQWALIYEANP